MKHKTVSRIAFVLSIVLCLLAFASCGASGEELAGTVADLPVKNTSNKFYLKIDGISGESTDSVHSKWIDVLDFSAGVTTLADNDNYSDFLPFVFTHKVDAATPKIQKNIMNGVFIRNAEFDYCTATAGTAPVVLKMEFSDIVLVDSKIGFAEDGSNVETVTLAAKDIKLTANELFAGDVRRTVSQEVSTPMPAPYSPENPFVPEKVKLPANNAYDTYLRINGVDGQSENSKHAKWIDVLDYTMGAECSIRKDGQRSSDFREFTFTHLVDIATPNIQISCFKGNVFSEIELQVCKNFAGSSYVVYNALLKKARIVKSEIYVDNNGDVLETVTVVPNEISWKTTSVSDNGAVGNSVEESFRK